MTDPKDDDEIKARDAKMDLLEDFILRWQACEIHLSRMLGIAQALENEALQSGVRASMFGLRHSRYAWHPLYKEISKIPGNLADE